MENKPSLKLRLAGKLKILSGLVVITSIIILTGCTIGGSKKGSTASESSVSSSSDNGSNSSTSDGKVLTGDVNILYLHHSTGENIWNGGVSSYVESYNSKNNKNYQITELAFPSEEYGWENYPYDYWNIWVNHAGNSVYQGQQTLEMLAGDYHVISWKHCFPVGTIEEDDGNSDISSSAKTLANYKLQYNALKDKIHEFPGTKFIAWTGAALLESETTEEQAQRTREFFEWVKNSWDEAGDNIYIWDFYELETEGRNYLKGSYAAGDSHPNESFSSKVAPYFGKRLVDVIEGRGDSGNIMGK